MYLTQEIINKVSDILLNGGIIAYPTDTVWGIGCIPESEEGVQKIYELKKRDAKKPLILMSNEAKNLFKYTKTPTEKEKEIISKFFPGALTLIMDKSNLTPDYMTSGLSTVGIRVPAHEVFKEIVNFCTPNKVLATTSANLSTQPSSLNKQSVINYFGDKIDYIFSDFGVFADGLESTIIRIQEDKISVLRKGAVEVERIWL